MAASDIPGPAGWAGPHAAERYLRALKLLEAVEGWARGNGLGDASTRAVWAVIARADLEGEVLTQAGLIQKSGVTRYLVHQAIRRAQSHGLLETEPYAKNRSHTRICLTEDGRRYLIASLNDFIRLTASV